MALAKKSGIEAFAPRGSLRAAYAEGRVFELDGVSVEYADWWFNVRCSNTEPLVRLNVETRGDEALMRVKTQELLKLMDA